MYCRRQDIQDVEDIEGFKMRTELSVFEIVVGLICLFIYLKAQHEAKDVELEDIEEDSL
jgi:hypothetical protein